MPRGRERGAAPLQPDSVWAMVGAVVGSVTMRSAIALRPASVRNDGPIRDMRRPAGPGGASAALVSLSPSALDHAGGVPAATNDGLEPSLGTSRPGQPVPVQAVDAVLDANRDPRAPTIAHVDFAVSISVDPDHQRGSNGTGQGSGGQSPRVSVVAEPVAAEVHEVVAPALAQASTATESRSQATGGRWARAVAAYARQTPGTGARSLAARRSVDVLA